MKLIYSLVFICCCSILPFQSLAQNDTQTNVSNSSGAAFQNGDISLNAGFSLGLIGYGWGHSGWNHSFTLPLTANLDLGVHEYFSVGAYIGYMGRSYSGKYYHYEGFDRVQKEFKHTFRNYSFGVHGAFHASGFLNEEFDLGINEKKVDLYGKILLGYEIYSWNYDENFDEDFSSNAGRVIFGPVLGVRYMFKPNIGGYIEGGRGAFGWLTIGASFKM